MGLRIAAAALVAAAVLCAPASAQAYRRGYGTSIGGATLGQGHIFWLGGGFPWLGIGWGMAVHPLVDVMAHGELIYGSPNEVDRIVVGGGGGARARLALLRGRTSIALTVDVAADIYGEGSGAAAIIDILSPGAEISFRLAPSVALHTRMQLVLDYVTRPQQFYGGFEVGAGVSVGLTSSLAFFSAANVGTTIGVAREEPSLRLEVFVGLELRMGHLDN